MININQSPKSKSRVRQFGEMLDWGLRLVASPNDYALYGFAEQGVTTKDVARFLSGPRTHALQASLNKEPDLLENKVLYNEHFNSIGLPIPQIIAIIGAPQGDNGIPHITDKSSLEEFIRSHLERGTEIVVKDSTGKQGRGVMVIVDLLEVEGKTFLLFSNGSTKPLDDALGEIIEPGGVWLVQERIEQHELLKELNPTSLNTLRLGTYRRNDGSVDLIFGVLRIGNPRAQIDAFNHGGIAVGVDLDSGNLADFGLQRPKYSREKLTEHPVMRVPFRDIRLPNWSEVVDLAQQFARHAGDNSIIGWDVAFTPNGPIFVEGNHNWDVSLAQAGRVGVLSDRFVEILQEDTGIDLDVTKLPAHNPARAIGIYTRASVGRFASKVRSASKS
ncbi:hypothetical protein FM102_11090 [Corynebacterium glutamicum]|nr:hypothetical protein FM102_11090 [Corynebacterium glutamicum]